MYRMAFLTEDVSILSKKVGAGGAGLYQPAAYEYSNTPSFLSGGKSRRRRRKNAKRKRRTAKKGVIGKAKSALKKMFRW